MRTQKHLRVSVSLGKINPILEEVSTKDPQIKQGLEPGGKDSVLKPHASSKERMDQATLPSPTPRKQSTEPQLCGDSSHQDPWDAQTGESAMRALVGPQALLSWAVHPPDTLPLNLCAFLSGDQVRL